MGIETAIIGGLALSIGGQLWQGHQANQSAKRQAREMERLANARYTDYKSRLVGEENAPGTVEQLHTQENEQYGSLLTGAASSGVKVEQFDRPDRLGAQERIDAEENLAMSNAALGDLKGPDRYTYYENDEGGTEKQLKSESQYQKELEEYEAEKARLTTLRDESQALIDSAIPEVGEAGNTLEALRNKITQTYNTAETNIYKDLGQAKLGLESALFNAEETRRQGEAALWGGILGAGGTALTGYGMARTPKSEGGWGIF